MSNDKSVDLEETTEEELNRINPQRNWDRRKYKRIIKQRGKSLYKGAYALGCRGHPGLVIESNFWPGWSLQYLFGADVTIKSLVDGVEENCSIFSCSPQAITKEEAERRAGELKTAHGFDLSVRYGYPVEEVKKWLQDWIDQGVLYYVLHDQNGQTVRAGQAFTLEDAEAHIARMKEGIAKGWYKEISNPRRVDMLTYPSPITSFDYTPPKE